MLEALQREGGVLGGEQSGHVIYLRDHVTGDGLAAALLLCARARAAARCPRRPRVMPRYPQAKENVPRRRRGELPRALARARSSGVNARARTATGRVLVRPSGTEPVVRVLAEAETAEVAESALC